MNPGEHRVVCRMPLGVDKMIHAPKLEQLRLTGEELEWLLEHGIMKLSRASGLGVHMYHYAHRKDGELHDMGGWIINRALTTFYNGKPKAK